MNDMSAPAPAVLRLAGLERRYKSGDGQLIVLDGVDLDIAPGEIVGLIGQSGSGKSSLLHAAGLLEKPSGGEVWTQTLIIGLAAMGIEERNARQALSRLTDQGLGIWPALLGSMVFSFFAGAAIERIIIRPVEGSKNPLAVVIVTLGLFLAINALCQLIFIKPGTEALKMPLLFPRGDFLGVSYAIWGRASVLAVECVARLRVPHSGSAPSRQSSWATWPRGT